MEQIQLLQLTGEKLPGVVKDTLSHLRLQKTEITLRFRSNLCHIVSLGVTESITFALPFYSSMTTSYKEKTIHQINRLQYLRVSPTSVSTLHIFDSFLSMSLLLVDAFYPHFSYKHPP